MASILFGVVRVNSDQHKYSQSTAISLVVANMVGTGVFTSLGFQLLEIQSAPVILLLWVLGGLMALCGALCYAELGAALPRSGGEYNFLSRIYHPAAGFISGWVSATVGFAAPTALAAITAAKYLSVVVPQVPEGPAALFLLGLVGLVHIGSRRQGARFQLFFTGIKIGLIVLFVLAAWALVGELQSIRWLPNTSDLPLLGTGAFAVALIYVNYAYTGWNAATYLAGEVHDVTRTLPRVLVIGTATVVVLYVLLHVMFLSVAPMNAMAGKIEIGYVVAEYAFGELGAQLIGLMLAILLVSTVSAMVLAGPRALQVIGQDFPSLGGLARENKHGVPYVAIGLQTGISMLLILTSTFDAILVFASFALALNTFLTVLGVFRLRQTQPELARPFRVPWYPWPVVIYLGITGWTLVFVASSRPVEALYAAGLIVFGGLFYHFSGGKRVAA